MNRLRLLAGIAIVLLVGVPSLSIPQAIAQASTPVPSTEPVPPPFRGGVQGFVRSDLGYALGGAVVNAFQTSGETRSAFTDASGFYRLDLPAGTWMLNATARGHAAKRAEAVVLADLPVNSNFTLNHTGPVLKGKVLDAKTGGPLAGATVEVHEEWDSCAPGQACLAEERRAMPAYYRMPLTTQSKADGSYALGLEKDGRVNVQAFKENFRNAWEGAEVRGDTTVDLELDPYPPKSAVLSGRVVDAKTGAPIAGAWVNAWPTHYREGATDASGGGSSGSGGTDGMTVAPSPPVVCDDADCPDPNCCYYEGNSTQTDRDGRFRMNMYPGTYALSVSAQDHSQHTQDVTLADSERETVDVALEPIPGDTVTLRGIVVDKATGKPVPWAWVSVENQQWGHYAGAQAGADGRFEVKTKPGYTQVWVRVEGMMYAQPAAEVTADGQADQPVSSDGNSTSASPGIRAPDDKRPYQQPEGSYYPWVRSARYADGQTVDLRAELQPKPKADVKVVGYVLNATNDRPIPGASVNLRNEDTGDWGYATTDKDGSFVLMGRPGVHTVTAYADGHYTNSVVVSVAGPQTRVDLALEPGRSQHHHCCIAYAEKGMPTPAMSGALAGGRDDTAPGAPSSEGSLEGRAATTDGDRQSAATYRATGEGLGPYDASTAPPPGEPEVGGSQVPGPGALLALAGVAAAALVLSRRKK